MSVHHEYEIGLQWADPAGTSSFSSFSRDHLLSNAEKTHAIEASSPVWFRGSKGLYNPGELLVAAIASGHMTRFLEIASQVGLVVFEYKDAAISEAELGSRGDGAISHATLRPALVVQEGPHATEEEIRRLHDRAQSMSLISASITVDVTIEPAGLQIVPAP